MKKIFALFFVLPILLSCDTGRINNNSPNVPNYTVNWQINLNLPAYSNLQFAGNHIVDGSYGARGIVVFNTGNEVYTAWDLTCPNQLFSSCSSPMSIIGAEAKCACDNSTYSLFTGLGNGQQYPMKQYRTELSGGYLYITN